MIDHVGVKKTQILILLILGNNPIKIDIREVTWGFDFLALDLANPKYVVDFKIEWKAQTCIKSHRISFNYDPIENEVS